MWATTSLNYITQPSNQLMRCLIVKSAKWLERARQLPLGHKARVDCPNCGEGTNTKAMIISHSAKAYSGSCFACSHQPFEMKGKQTLAEIAELKRINNESLLERDGEPLKLPEDYSTSIPLEGRLWLYSNGITEKLKAQYKIGYSERLKRVILPVYDTKGILTWYQCRAIHKGQTPKYMQPRRCKDSVVFQSKQSTAISNLSTVVVVEDMASTIRVGESSNTVSLLGTKASTVQINYLSKFDRVITWFDNDKAGKRGSAAIRQSCGLLTEGANIITEHDPKFYSKQQIQEILWQHLK